MFRLVELAVSGGDMYEERRRGQTEIRIVERRRVAPAACDLRDEIADRSQHRSIPPVRALHILTRVRGRHTVSDVPRIRTGYKPVRPFTGGKNAALCRSR
jgi:hypothetical protein